MAARSRTAAAVRSACTAGGLAAVAGGLFLISRGRIHVDTGWGRRLVLLGPMSVEIAAPRDLVFEQISSPYLGRTPAALAGKLEVLERTDDMVVARHRTPVALLDAVTVEAVRFDPPSLITFRLLQGPVPHAVEEFLLEEIGSGTRLSYRGQLGSDFWELGRMYASRLVKPVWEGTVSKTIEQIRQGAEQRAQAQAERVSDKPKQKPDDQARPGKTTEQSEFFWETAEPLLATPGVQVGTVMNSPCLRLHGEFLAMPEHRSGDLIAKLPRERVDELVESGTGLPFAPAGRTFKEWVRVSTRDEALWAGLLQEAMAFVGS